VIRTSWNIPPSGWERTTNAGERTTPPVAQLGRQLLTVSVPLPIAVRGPHDDHVTADIVVSPWQPMSILVGRTAAIELGLHAAVLGRVAEVVGAAAVAIPDKEDVGAVAASVTTLMLDVADGGELMAQPIPNPLARAAATPAATPIRTTVLRRTVITTAFRPATEGNGAVLII
jgi:hypothetical protein